MAHHEGGAGIERALVRLREAFSLLEDTLYPVTRQATGGEPQGERAPGPSGPGHGGMAADPGGGPSRDPATTGAPAEGRDRNRSAASVILGLAAATVLLVAAFIPETVWMDQEGLPAPEFVRGSDWVLFSALACAFGSAVLGLGVLWSTTNRAGAGGRLLVGQAIALCASWMLILVANALVLA